MIEVEFNQQTASAWIDAERLRDAVRRVLAGEGIRRGAVSLAVVDDPTIHQLNRRHLQHDYATDVLSFLLERDGDYLEGEVIVSADTAESSAADYGWPADCELLLYVVHGCLHLVGYDDQTPDAQAVMREKETEYLRIWKLTPPGGVSSGEDTS